MRAGAFLDRDGVLNELILDPVSGAAESPLRVEDVQLIPGAAVAARSLSQLGYVLACVSNQPAAAKGRVTVEQLLAVHQRVVELLEQEGVTLSASRLCLHHPQGSIAELAGPCQCRKPAPGMLLELASELDLGLRESWMVGDTDADVTAGKAAGCRTLLIRHPGSAHKRLRGSRADLVADSLDDAIKALWSCR